MTTFGPETLPDSVDRTPVFSGLPPFLVGSVEALFSGTDFGVFDRSVCDLDLPNCGDCFGSGGGNTWKSARAGLDAFSDPA